MYDYQGDAIDKWGRGMSNNQNQCFIIFYILI